MVDEARFTPAHLFFLTRVTGKSVDSRLLAGEFIKTWRRR